MKLNYIIIPLITIFVSVLGSRFTSGGIMSWYQTIKLPAWTPAGSIIGAAWTIIFILGTISALWVWNKFDRGRVFNWIIALFLINAFLNLGWSWLFFNQHLISWAFLEAICLGLSVLILIILIRPSLPWASLLLYPYLFWVSFASYLTYVIWRLN